MGLTTAKEKDQVLIRVKVFGLSRSEMFTRQGHSPMAEEPSVLRPLASSRRPRETRTGSKSAIRW